jgi:hypothetical protein
MTAVKEVRSGNVWFKCLECGATLQERNAGSYLIHPDSAFVSSTLPKCSFAGKWFRNPMLVELEEVRTP